MQAPGSVYRKDQEKRKITKNKERIDSCLSGSEFVNPFFAFSSLLFFLV